jgi:hypothetical protein
MVVALSVDEALDEREPPDDEPPFREPSDVTSAQRAAYHALALARPTARLHLCKRRDRVACVYLRAAWATMWWDDASGRQWLQNEAHGLIYIDDPWPRFSWPILPACTWCGTPTSGWCGACLNAPTPGNVDPLCSECGGCDYYAPEARCRKCHIGYEARAARLSVALQPLPNARNWHRYSVWETREGRSGD